MRVLGLFAGVALVLASEDGESCSETQSLLQTRHNTRKAQDTTDAQYSVGTGVKIDITNVELTDMPVVAEGRDCPEGYDEITDQSECEAAADQSGRWRGQRGWCGAQYGCITHSSGDVFFNSCQRNANAYNPGHPRVCKATASSHVRGNQDGTTASSYVRGNQDGTCPAGSTRVSIEECPQLDGVSLSNCDSARSCNVLHNRNHRVDCAAHFTPGAGCFVNINSAVYSTAEGCTAAQGVSNHWAVCEAGTTSQVIAHTGSQGSNTCSTASVSEAECLEAVVALLPQGTGQGRRNLVTGSWRHVPVGCSVQSRGDWAAHFNRRASGSNDGGYSPVCTGPEAAHIDEPQLPPPAANQNAGQGNNVWVHLHNEKRALHGACPIVWNEAVAAGMQEWVDGLTSMVHADSYGLPPPQGPAGENLAWGSHGISAERTVNMWYNEVNDCIHATGCEHGRGGAATGHFTAMVWKGVQSIGCAISANGQFSGCRYRSGDRLSADSANMGGQYANNVAPAGSAASGC